MDNCNLQTFRHTCIIFNPKTQEKKIGVLVGFEPEQASLDSQLLESDYFASKNFTGASVRDTTAIKTRNLKDSVYPAQLFIMERHTRNTSAVRGKPVYARASNHSATPAFSKLLSVSARTSPGCAARVAIRQAGEEYTAHSKCTYLFMYVSPRGEILLYIYIYLVSCHSVSVTVYSFN
jgi:hypothetical protein